MLELRHLRYETRLDRTFAGMCFHNLSGLMQRKVESFVNQLQREARRMEKDVLMEYQHDIPDQELAGHKTAGANSASLSR
jgi:hypothetical protein